MSIRERYEKEIAAIKEKLTKMCRLTELAIENAVSALSSRDNKSLTDVIENDKTIDNAERDIEQDCLKVLLMEQPVAGDFLQVSAALKMITDLERIGDQARDIAEIGLYLQSSVDLKHFKHLSTMSRYAVLMVKDSVLCYINADLIAARGLNKRDDAVDSLFEQIKQDIVESIKNDDCSADHAISVLMIAKYLERIGDHAVNIGEWVEYSLTGERINNS